MYNRQFGMIVTTLIIAFLIFVGCNVYMSGAYIVLLGIELEEPWMFAVIVTLLVLLDAYIILTLKKKIGKEKAVEKATIKMFHEELMKDKAARREDAERIPSPCRVILTRPRIYGGANIKKVSIFLNGIDVGLSKHGKTIEFVTDVKDNHLTYPANPNPPLVFQAAPGGEIRLRVIDADYTKPLEIINEDSKETQQ